MSGQSDQPPTGPEALDSLHDLHEFDCGEASLDHWLRQRALSNQATGASRTFVVCQGTARVVGYYCLSACTISHAGAVSSLRRNMPDPIPMMLLGRLAVDLGWRGRGIGSGLLKDAVARTATIAQQVGVRGLLVHAISEVAIEFYARYGFVGSPADTRTLMVRLADIVRTIGAIRPPAG